MSYRIAICVSVVYVQSVSKGAVLRFGVSEWSDAAGSLIGCRGFSYFRQMTRTTVKPAEAPEWMDMKALTLYVAVSERTLRAWIHRPVDPLPAARVGTKILVRRAVFDRWL